MTSPSSISPTGTQLSPSATDRMTTIDISKEALKFSGAHFTVFSATERERLHGHNFRVRAQVSAPVDDNGMCFNYQEIKSRLKRICNELDEYMLIPEHSPHLDIEQRDDCIRIGFNGEHMEFLRSDARVLPIRNTTVEEFSHYIVQTLVNSDDFFQKNGVASLTVSVSSGDGQWGSTSWTPDH